MMDLNRSKVCCTCGSFQHVLHETGTGAYCCRCYVVAGNPPADWHPVCMLIYNARKGIPVEENPYTKNELRRIQTSSNQA